MEWKRALHKKNGTVLIEFYGYENIEDRLWERLSEELTKYNVKFNPQPLDELFIMSNMKKDNIYRVLANNMSTIIALIKNKNLDQNALVEMCDKTNRGTKALACLTIPVYAKYQEYLKKNDLRE